MKTYKIVYAEDVTTLSKKVNNHIKAGFICQGGVSLALVGLSEYQNESVQIMQAMTYEESKNE